MKHFLSVIVFGLLCLSLNAQTALQDILKTDREFNSYAIENGFYKAMLHYADDSIVKLNNGVLPVVGKAALAKQYSGAEDTKDISWKPIGVNVSDAGDLGYTWGNWQYKAADTIYYGNYVTIWNRTAHGWKVLLDGGNDTPSPE